MVQIGQGPNTNSGHTHTSVAYVFTNLPKLTYTELSYTGIGWENPVSKSFLPKTKFRLGFTR